MKKYKNSDTKNAFTRKYTNRSKKNELKVINLSTLTWSFYMIEKGEEFRLMLIIHIVNKRNDLANVILLRTVHDRVSVLFNLLQLGSTDILKVFVI